MNIQKDKYLTNFADDKIIIYYKVQEDTEI